MRQLEKSKQLAVPERTVDEEELNEQQLNS